MRWLVVLAIVAGCHRQLATSMWCAPLRPPTDGGLNPLLVPGAYACYDDAAACPAGCIEVTSPRWACFVTTGAPVPMTTCYPDPFMCLASRPHRSDVGECAEVDAVSCSTASHHLSCQVTAADCEISRDLVTSVLHVPVGPCVRFE